jgi:hypothetical protein
MDYIKKLKEELQKIPDNSIIFLETTEEKLFELGLFSVKRLSDKNYSGIIISANRPYQNLVSLYEKNGINVGKMFFLDCISKNLNGQIEAKNVKFIENLSSLTDLSLSIHKQINNGQGSKKFIFFDSITTMLIHNKPYVFVRFIHSIITKMRLTGVGGILISLTGDNNNEIRADIAQLCDKIITI